MASRCMKGAAASNTNLYEHVGAMIHKGIIMKIGKKLSCPVPSLLVLEVHVSAATN